MVDSLSLLSLRGVHAGYGAKKILQGLDMVVCSGEVAALLGPNGAGKSTVLRTIMGILRPSQGQIRFRGHELRGLTPNQVNVKGVSYLCQTDNVFRDLSVAENLAMACLAHAPSRGDARQRAEEAATIFPPLKKRWMDRVGLLSGGERQMLAIGMVLVQRPQLMLLDEPSAGLSPAMVHEVLEKLTALCHQGSAAVLLVEQNVRVAAKLANRIYHLVDGVARELPTTERLSDEDLLRALGIVRTPLPNACI